MRTKLTKVGWLGLLVSINDNELGLIKHSHKNLNIKLMNIQKYTKTFLAGIAIIGAALSVSANHDDKDDTMIVKKLNISEETVVTKGDKAKHHHHHAISREDLQKVLKQFPFVDEQGCFDKNNWCQFVKYCKSQSDHHYGMALLHAGKHYCKDHSKDCNHQCKKHDDRSKKTDKHHKDKK